VQLDEKQTPEALPNLCTAGPRREISGCGIHAAIVQPRGAPHWPFDQLFSILGFAKGWMPPRYDRCKEINVMLLTASVECRRHLSGMWYAEFTGEDEYSFLCGPLLFQLEYSTAEEAEQARSALPPSPTLFSTLNSTSTIYDLD
jgi:hypothetical protein